MENAEIPEYQRKQIHLSLDDACQVLDDEHDDWEVIADRITSKGRWTVHHTVIVKNKVDGAFFKGEYVEPATENQGGWDDNNPDGVDLIEVFPKQKTITIYV